MTTVDPGLELLPTLAATYFLDAQHPAVVEFAQSRVRTAQGRAAAVALFYAVRDEIRYNPYNASRAREQFKASSVLARGEDFCVPKAILLAAAARAVGIPSRLGFVDVRNHLATPRLLALMRTDLFAYHGYALLELEGTWVKLTPAFNRSLCERLGVAPLEFDGVHDAMLQPADRQGRSYMEYVRDRGVFDDFPLEAMVEAWREVYPHFFAADGHPMLPVEGSLETDELR